MELLFAVQIAFPRFRGNPVFVSRVCENPESDKSRKLESHIREKRKPGFHENAEMLFGLQIATPSAISASRRAARKCRKKHLSMLKSVYFRRAGFKKYL